MRESRMAITMGCNVEEACPADLVPTEDGFTSGVEPTLSKGQIRKVRFRRS